MSVNEAYRKAKALGDEAEDAAAKISRKASREFDRAGRAAADALEEAHEVSKDYPHATIALAAALGFLVGLAIARR